MQSVLITGTSSGIGRANALYLDKPGYTVFSGVRKEEDARALLREAPGNPIPLIIDMNDGKSMDDAFKQISKYTGLKGLSALVNNAGVPLEFVDPEKL